jgi:hypothetical protein
MRNRGVSCESRTGVACIIAVELSVPLQQPLDASCMKRAEDGEEIFSELLRA